MPENNKLKHVGTLSDEDIKEYCGNGKLIISNFTDANIKQACYELRASNTYYDLADGNRKYQLEQGEYILIKPKQLIVIITMESLELPKDMLGRILTKGKLFSIGLLPVNTYADPGFTGELGIVLYNLSNSYIKVKPGEAIAKIEFSKLFNDVKRSYNGQHGYQTGIWPIPTDMILTQDEIDSDQRIKSESDELELTYGKVIGRITKRIFKFERYLVLATIVYLLFSILLIAYLSIKDSTSLSIVISMIVGVISNALFAGITYFATNIKR
jgi:dCTP deaminase